MTAPPHSRPGAPGNWPSAAAVDSVVLSGEELDQLGEAARWAPSIHNSQPWRLRRLVNGMGVVDDTSRSVPVIDPYGRDRTISCGSALYNAMVALRTLGYATRPNLMPDLADPALIGTVRAVDRANPADQDVLQHKMITLRHTHRRVYRSHLVAEEDLLDLRQAVAAEGARLSVAEPSTRRRLAYLLRTAVQAQLDNPELRAEVERWVRRGGYPSSIVDGIPSNALGTSPFPVDSLVHGGTRRVPDTDEVEAELARSTVLVVSTREDTRHDWVIAGLALERLLLTATAKGLVATFAEQALQNPTVRPQIAELLEIWGHPQVLLRVGRPLVDAPLTPRRPLMELFEV